MGKKMKTQRKPEDRLKDWTISTQAKTFLAKKSCIFFLVGFNNIESEDTDHQYIGQDGTNTLDSMEQIQVIK